jgi:hypothetical protein
MSRTLFATSTVQVIVASAGYFDVHPNTPRANEIKPVYRGELAELGPGIRGIGNRLAVRPDSARLATAVRAWAAACGAAAVAGALGPGRDGSAPKEGPVTRGVR